MIRVQKIRLAALLLLAAQHANAQQKFVFGQPKMGSPFTITLYANDSAQAILAAGMAMRLADSLNAMLSDYLDSSELNRLSRTSGQGRYIPVSAPLFDILWRAGTAAALSHGAYDVTIGPVVRLWRQARKTHLFPAKDSIHIALSRSGYRYLHLDSAHRSVMLERSGMQLDIGGLGKGFVAQAALDLLSRQGITTAMVNAGGKIVTGTAPPGRKGWLIGINAPGEKEVILPGLLELEGLSVATSGDIYQYVEINGKRYSHIVNPSTGIGLTRRRNVTAIAKDGTTADWLATACSILPFRRAQRLIGEIPGAALLVTELRHGRIKQLYSSNFINYLKK